jgi:HEAT repeat protein
VEIGDEAVPYLIDDLTNPSTYIRINVAKVLGEIGSEDAVPALISSLQDTSSVIGSKSRVCDSAAQSLEKIGNTQAHEALAFWKKGNS